MRARIASLLVAILLTFGSGVLLLRCPFLQHKSCCSRELPKQCPLSKSIDSCPYVATESKAGLVEVKFVTPSLPAVTTAAEPVLLVRNEEPPPSWQPSQIDRHILLRVLRI